MEWVIPFEWNPKSLRRIEPANTLFFIGSCFAENIASKMLADRFDICLNPFGILYNPVSIAKAFNHCQTQTLFDKNKLFYSNELWHSELHHSEFSGVNQYNVLDKINSNIIKAHTKLKQSSFNFITFGTTKTYQSVLSKEIVGNCHKRPSSDFVVNHLTEEEIILTWAPIFENNKDKEFYLSISPIRYLREGLIESNNSKAILRIAINKLTQQFSNVYYFPAFELVNDVLRDYRFFNPDMVHPNQQAIDFVYNFFFDKLLSSNSKEYAKEWRKVSAMLHHRALNPDSQKWKEFEVKRDKALKDFEEKWENLHD